MGIGCRPELDFRPAAVEDLEAIADLYRDELMREPNSDTLNNCIRDYPSVVAIEKDSQRLVGFVYCGEFAPDVLEIYNILVDFEFQSLGIGSRCLTELHALIQDTTDYAGVILVNSSLYPEMKHPFQDGTSFYKRNGYTLAASTAGSRIFFRKL